MNLVLNSRNCCSLSILVLTHPLPHSRPQNTEHYSQIYTKPSLCNSVALRLIRSRVLWFHKYVKQQYAVRGKQFIVCWWRKKAEMWLREAVPLVWMRPVCCTIRVVGLWSTSSLGNGRAGERGLKNDAIPSQAWSPQHEWMNNEQQPLCAVRTHLCVCMRMFGGRMATWRVVVTLRDEGWGVRHCT